ncbi:MAG: hypothetical protein ACREX3_14415 [Gammaproteobacteria bacterium]
MHTMPTGRLRPEVRCLLLIVLFFSAPTFSAEMLLRGATSELIDLYCASVDLDMRERCIVGVISPLEDATTISDLRLLGEALRTLRHWTDDEPELVSDLRRREQNAYKAILDLKPHDSDAMYFLAVSQDKQQDKNRLLRELLTVHPGHPAASRVLAMNLLRRKGANAAREAFELLSAAYRNADPQTALLLAAEASSALAQIDAKATAQFRDSVKEKYGVFSTLARATAAVKSGAPMTEKMPVAKVPIDKFCLEPYLLFDTEACKRGVQLLLQLEESAPRDPQILRALIAGMQGLNKPSFGAAHNYNDELRHRIEKLMEVDGRSAELLLDYANVLEGKEKIAALESILAIDRTSSAEVHAMLSRALINDDQYVDGINQMRTAFERAQGSSKEHYGAELVQMLRFYGMPQDALEADRIEQALQKT